MKKTELLGKTIVLILLVFTCFTFLLISCKGATGPAGAAGAPGAPGTEFKIDFQQGVYPTSNYTLASDTYIADSCPDTNYGQCQNLYVGVDTTVPVVYRAMLRFDLTLVTPSNVQVTNAYLTMNGSSAADQVTVTAYPMLSQFTEGTGTCAGLDNSGINIFATWIYPWASTPGGNFSSQPMSNSVYFNSNIAFVPIVFNLDTSVIQGWIANPSANYGMLLKSENETTGSNYISFVSREDTSYIITNRPKLTIYYKLP